MIQLLQSKDAVLSSNAEFCIKELETIAADVIIVIFCLT